MTKKMAPFVTVGLLVLQPAAAGTEKPATLSGMATVLSGDTLTVAGTTLHLQGIEAPEKGQNCMVASGRRYDCGLVAKTALMDLTVATPVSCTLTGGKRDDLPLARCRAGGYDLSEGMVHTGWALAWPTSHPKYTAVEKSAQKSGRGLWRGKFISPWNWRRGERL